MCQSAHERRSQELYLSKLCCLWREPPSASSGQQNSYVRIMNEKKTIWRKLPVRVPCRSLQERV